MSQDFPLIPLVDLALQHREVGDAVLKGWQEVLDRSAYILGDEVETFEEAFARYAGVGSCIGVGNGTDALELALRSLGVGVGDEVIVPANTFIATALAVVRCGANPALVDVDPVYQLMEPEGVRARLTPRTRAVMPVHLFGQLAPMDELVALAGETGLHVVEDAAQAQGARRNGVSAGALGAVTGTSFYPGKNLGAYGDAGAVLTNDPDLAARVRALRNYGSTVKYHHEELGFNSRLDTVQAVVLLEKLRFLDSWNESRREAAGRYDEMLSSVPEVGTPAVAPGNLHVFHLYVVRVPDRDRVMAELNSAGIGAGVHYPEPIHLQGAFRSLGHTVGDFPVAERAAREILSLPLFPGITGSQQERVVEQLARALR